MVADHFGVEVAHDPDYDVLIAGLRYDVKTIGPCRVPPRPSYLVAVNNSTTGSGGFRRQGCDRYIFTRIVTDPLRGYLCGWYDADRFHAEARLVRKGEEFAPGMVARECDKRVMPIHDLNPFEE